MCVRKCERSREEERDPEPTLFPIFFATRRRFLALYSFSRFDRLVTRRFRPTARTVGNRPFGSGGCSRTRFWIARSLASLDRARATKRPASSLMSNSNFFAAQGQGWSVAACVALHKLVTKGGAGDTGAKQKAAPLKNSAFVFVKPAANTEATRALVRKCSLKVGKDHQGGRDQGCRDRQEEAHRPALLRHRQQGDPHQAQGSARPRRQVRGQVRHRLEGSPRTRTSSSTPRTRARVLHRRRTQRQVGQGEEG